jgi:hypothetical protein
MENLGDHIILNIAIRDISVWATIRESCKRFAHLLKYDPNWESRFLYTIRKNCHTEYRLRSTNRLHRPRGLPAVEGMNCHCNLDLKYFRRDDSGLLYKHSGIRSLGGGRLTITARNGYLIKLEAKSNGERELTIRNHPEGIHVNYTVLREGGFLHNLEANLQLCDIEREQGLVTIKYSSRQMVSRLPKLWAAVCVCACLAIVYLS